jgi:MOSC domain-containing protein YiiM
MCPREKVDMTELAIVQVNTGQPKPLAPHANCTHHRERVVVSAFVKRRVAGESIMVRQSGLVGDAQADMRVHGGMLKAVYAYPKAHLSAWQAELGEPMLPGESFGENFTVEGADENIVCVDDMYSCEGVLLCVTMPRQPCYKLARHLGDDVPRRMIQNGRCGWYFSVLTGGELPTTGAVLKLEARPKPELPIALVFAQKMRRTGGKIPGPSDGE